MAISPRSGLVRFGVFEIDLDSGELRKQGVKIKLHEQPFTVLAVLMERPGQVITREELSQRLWPADTFVESDLGINSAMMKLRAALGDSAENPRFIETLPRRGYRLIVPVEDLNRARKVPLGSSASVQLQDGQSLGLAPAQPVVPPESTGPPSKPFLDSSNANAANLQTASRSKLSVWLWGAFALVFVAVVAFGVWRLLRPKPDPYSIAVLPLKNLSPEPGSDYFSDGLTDEIISNLSVIDGLHVKSQTSSFYFKDKPRDIHSIGAQLGANMVLEGAVLRTADKLRVNVQLVRVSDDYPLWSGRFERPLKDIFAVQDEISRSVVNALRLKLGRFQRRYNTNLEAYDLYLKARALSVSYTGPGSREDLEASIPLYEAAISKDTSFAPAYAGIADSFGYLSGSPRSFAPEVAYRMMKESCEKALQLDPLLAEAHSCMGLVHSRELAWEQAEKDFRQTFQLNSNLSLSHRDYAFWVLFPLGRFQEAEQELYVAAKLDPLSTSIIHGRSLVLLAELRYDEVLESCRRVSRVAPNDYYAQQIYARALTQKGRLDEGIAILEKLGKGSEGFLGYAYAKAGRRADAEQIGAQHTDMPWIEALAYAGLEDKEKAMDGLEKMAAIGDPRVGLYARSPEFAFLRGEPRFTELLKSQGLPDRR